MAISTTSYKPDKSSSEGLFPRTHRLAFVLVTALFFLWGMSNNLTDILVQQFRKSFELTPMEAQLVQTAVFFGYFCMAIPAALLMERRGYKAGILSGLLLFGSGTLFFWPAAVLNRYLPFLIALFLVGCGSAVLETAANTFIAQFGSVNTSERRLNFSQSFNPPGTITGVVFGAYFIFSGVELNSTQITSMKMAGTYTSYLHSEVMRVVPIYVVLGCVVLLWAFFIWRTAFPVFANESKAAEGHRHVSFAGLLPHSRLWMSVTAQFFYCGAQVSTWSSLIPYLKQYTVMSERQSAYWLIGNLIAFAAGRFVATVLMRWVLPMRLLLLYAFANMAFLAVAISHPGKTGAIAVLITSFFMAPMFPTIFAAGVRGLGAAAKIGGSVIVMAVVGAAIAPPVLGWVARRYDSYAAGYAVPALCYLIVAAYAVLIRFYKTPTSQPPPAESAS